MKTLVIDIGGSNVKIWRTGYSEKIKFPSGKDLTPQQFAAQTKKLIDEWNYDRVSIGYPGEILNGHPVAEPYNLGDGWIGFDYAKAFGAPVKIMNDACMQALGSYEGGRMLYLGLGTSMGSVFMIDGKIIPLALGHLMFTKSATFEQRLSRKGLEHYGVKRWRQSVVIAARTLKAAFLADYVVLGGGNAKKMKTLPETCRRGANEMAYVGGVRMWEADGPAPGLAVFPEKSQTA